MSIVPTRTPVCHPHGCGLSTLKAVAVVNWQNMIMCSLKEWKNPKKKKYAKNKILKNIKKQKSRKKSKFYSV